MGHDHCHGLKDYKSRDEQYCTPFYSNVMARDHFFHVLQFLHFENNDDPPNHDDPYYNRLWKIWKIFDTLNNKFCELYNLTEHLAVDKVIMLYKGRATFWQYIPKERKRFGIKIYKLWLFGLHLWYECVFRQTKATCHSSNNSNARNGVARDWATKFSWIVISPCLLCLMICSNEKSVRVEQFAMTGVECHEILDQNR